MRIPVQFLMRVWGHTCEEGDTVYLSTKFGPKKRWKDHSFIFKRGIQGQLKEWFQNYSPDKYDIYFCPLAFREGARQKKDVKAINILWSDIDEGKAKLKPTILWQSSPGRLQGLWFMSGKALNCDDGQDLNKALTYYMDADKGGWDLTQVLRVPGTKNHKYESLPPVKILEEDPDLRYSPARVSKRIGFKFNDPEKEVKITHTNNMTFEAVFSKHRRQMPNKVKQLLTQKNVTGGKRSDIIWYMENKLNDAGLTPEEIITLIKYSAWNKYAGRADEEERLKTELEKIIESKVEVPDEEAVEETVEEETSLGLEIQSYYDLMCSPDQNPGWLIKGFWLNRSHGIVAGEPKSFKSTLALDLAISVASGAPFLGKHEVIHPGPVIYIQNENSQWIMKDRVGKISAARGVIGEVNIEDDCTLEVKWAPDIPLYMVNQQSFLLSDPLHQQLLEKMIIEYEPVLIILDPLYLMFDGDINSAKELAPILQWLLDVRYRLNVGIMLVHHYGKSNGDSSSKRGGQRMLGSTTLHGWTESAWYVSTDNNNQVEDTDEEDLNATKAEGNVTIEREFRGAGLHPKVDLTITMGEIGSFEYEVSACVHQKKVDLRKGISVVDSEKEIFQMLSLSKKPLNEDQIQAKTGFTKNTIIKAIDILAEKGAVRRTKQGIIKR